MSSHEPEPDDADTGPLHVSRLRTPLGEGPGDREPRYDAPLSVNPRPVHRDRRPVVLVAAAAAAVVGLGALAWVFWPSSGGEGHAGAPTTTTETESREEAETRLLGMVPPGYAADACEAVVPVNGALAQVSCDKNDDTGGPLTATYTLAKDGRALRELFDGVVNASAVVNCPGNIQSPVLCPTGVSNAFGDSGR
ncbi:hypothetical protein [Mycolicibacterium austroafricanum]|uniref:Serine/threonine protein kinase n=1 Tax=Mycolicibacterium austroafricanum TaxID=39687 RepID=A0ABT8HK06_MYCAO|nr:hypothetical protein [Mycolicibacterium austroafricanum]MDN4521100.1 hypothetical protein [Mycolicibacterium austroafricanum]